MNKKVIFWDIDKKKISKIEKDTKYILITKDNYNVLNTSLFDINPIIVKYNGSLIIDLENNKIINNEILHRSDIKPIISYFNNHDISYKLNIDNNKVYQIKIESKNYYRMLILPMFIKNKFKNVKTAFNYPIKINKELYQNYIISDKISTISNLNTIINYLDAKQDNIIELSKIIDNINSNLNDIGYFKDYSIRKEYVNESKAKS